MGAGKQGEGLVWGQDGDSGLGQRHSIHIASETVQVARQERRLGRKQPRPTPEVDVTNRGWGPGQGQS